MKKLFILFLLTIAPAVSTRATLGDEDSLFDRVDRNGDGSVASSEIEGSNKRLFQRLLRTSDENNDGRLSREEFVAGTTSDVTTGEDRLRPIEDASAASRDGARRRQPARSPNTQRIRSNDRPQAAQFFRRLDRNGDEKLAKAELPEGLRRAFDRLDVDNSGFLEKNELARLTAMMTDRGKRRPGAASRSPSANRSSGDRNRANRRPGANRRTTNRAGTAKNRGANNTSPQRLFQLLDRNKDGKISRQEAPPRLQQQFRRFDADGDGFLEPAEIARQSGGGRRRKNK